AVPPLSFTTCLITCRTGCTSLFVTVQVFVWPTAIEPAQSAESERPEQPGAPSPPAEEPALAASVVPSGAAPANEAVHGLVPVTDIVKLAALAVPPLSFTTCLITCRIGWTSLLVTVQVLVWPLPIPEPAQSAESERA